MLSNNAFIMPALFDTPTLSPKDRMVSIDRAQYLQLDTFQMMFNRLFNHGKKIIVPLLLISIISLSLASYLSVSPTSREIIPGLLPLITTNRRTTLGFSAFLVFLNLPYTARFVLAGVKELSEAEKRNGEPREAEADTDRLIKTWMMHHNARLVLVFGALVLSVLEGIAP